MQETANENQHVTLSITYLTPNLIIHTFVQA